MSVAGPCEICLTGTVEHTCDRCGNLVCERHFDETSGFCVECSADMAGDDRKTQPDPTDTYQF
jgi:hypothetical protein